MGHALAYHVLILLIGVLDLGLDILLCAAVELDEARVRLPWLEFLIDLVRRYLRDRSTISFVFLMLVIRRSHAQLTWSGAVGLLGELQRPAVVSTLLARLGPNLGAEGYMYPFLRPYQGTRYEVKVPRSIDTVHMYLTNPGVQFCMEPVSVEV